MVYLGIDVSKKSLHVAFPNPQGYRLQRYTNDGPGFAQLVAPLPDSQPVA